MGVSTIFDRTLALASTKYGDIFVLGCFCVLFGVHCLRGTSLNEAARRISFWLWASIWCVGTYVIACHIADVLTPRPTPLASLQLHDVQQMYGVKLRTSAAHSFPSGHALAYMTFTLASLGRFARMSLILGLLGTVMLSVRLILGLHWLSDIVLGSLPLTLVILALAAQPLWGKIRNWFETLINRVLIALANGGFPILSGKSLD
ncbi:MAG: phosphatase PAP2 family protein [Terriglobales bacterium]